MTNEELAVLVQQGQRERLLELWEQVRRLAVKLARPVLAAGAAVELEDLMQAGFLAMMEAVDRYQPSSGLQFTSYFTICLKQAFAEATGYRSEKQKRDPLHHAGSLNAPLDEEDGDTLGDLIPDQRDPIEEADQRLFQDWLRGTLGRAVDTLPADQARVIRLRYYAGKTLEETAVQVGVGKEAVRQRQNKALRALRRSRYLRGLEEYVESHTNYYAHVGAHSGRSPVEETAFRREELSQRWERMHQKEA